VAVFSSPRLRVSASPLLLRVLNLGRRAYGPTVELQHRLVDRVARGGRPCLLLVEHDPPVITLGRRADGRNVLASPAELARRGIELTRITRGGDVTWHGPGQLVAYPILPLTVTGLNLHRHQRNLEEAVIRLLERHSVRAERIDGLTGVWVGGRKIAAIGVAARRWVTYHGVSLNVDCDLAGFGLIVPCGLHGREATSMRQLGLTVSLDEVKREFVEEYRRLSDLPLP